MISTIIVEDEPDQIDGMVTLFAKYCPEVAVVATAGSKQEAIEAILEHHPDLVFLDIRLMGNETAGFEVLQAVSLVDFELIFLSSKTEMALQAVNLERQVCFFLEKPVQIDRVVLAVKKAVEMLALKTRSNSAALLKERLVVPSNQGLALLFIKEIIRCEADTWLTHVHLIQRAKYLAVSKNLGWFARILPVERFIRVHHSHIVNLDYVLEYSTREGVSLTLSNGEKIPVGPVYKEEVLRRMHLL